MVNLRNYVFLAVAFLLPGFGFYALAADLGAPVEALFFGISILGAAFLLTWGAEVAQLDVSKSLALAVLALIVVMPEYAVDMYFTWVSASNPEYTHFAVANMTGANRLLIGVAWPLIVFLYWFKTRKKALTLNHADRVELSFLGVASVYALLIPLKGTISIADSFLLIGLFVFYIYRVSKTHTETPHLVGPSELIGKFQKNKRRLFTIFIFVFSALVIFSTTEHFAEALVESGKFLGVDEFLLVQWLAPLSSEAPEFIIASLFVLRGLATVGFGALLSSKINQWTLLIGMIPIIFSLASGSPTNFILDDRQVHEILITAAQSIFAMAIMLNIRISFKGAISLFVLFFAQFLIPEIRIEITIIYFILAFYLLWRDRSHVGAIIKSFLK